MNKTHTKTLPHRELDQQYPRVCENQFDELVQFIYIVNFLEHWLDVDQLLTE